MSQPETILVLGYGSELRGDDAVGRRAAEAIVLWELPQVRVISSHQLLPEHAAQLALVDRVYFVDASIDADSGLKVTQMQAEPPDAPHTHFAKPSILLYLAQTLYGVTPRAWQIGIPAYQFEIGTPLSPQAKAGLSQALQFLRRTLDG